MNREWHYYRLPKASHSYDGAHGWNTEWPRIREIGETDLLATMHGTFWRFPAHFSVENSKGIAPRSNYLKVIGDFCRWNDRVVFGCDDSAKSEFLNTRTFKAKHAAAKQSNSNLWFVDPDRIDHLGPAIGRGSVWLRDNLEAGQVSDPFLFAGYDHRQLNLVCEGGGTFLLEVDREGTNQWESLREITVPAQGNVSHLFGDDEIGSWIRLKSPNPARQVTAHFQYRNRDQRSAENDPIFAGILPVGKPGAGGLMQSLSYDRMGIVEADKNGKIGGFYEVNQKLEIVTSDDRGAAAKLVHDVIQPDSTYEVDEASVILVEDGKRYRLPKNDAYIKTNSVQKPRKTLASCLEKSLTKGAEVSVGSTHGEYLAAHAVDGIIHDDEKRWISSPGGAGSWIEINLGEEKEISEIWVVTGWKGESPYTAKNFDIMVKKDGAWQTECEVVENSDIEMRFRLPQPVRTQFIRVESRETSHFRVYEIAAFVEPLDIEMELTNAGPARVCREVATERDLLNVHGAFYELPARNAQGLAKIRPIATHNLAIQDFCSHNGLLFFTGVDSSMENDRIFHSGDGKVSVWAGVVDDLWKLGKPRGRGGPWFNTRVTAHTPSDPYLMRAYDRKSVTITSANPATIRLEVDIDGTGLWIPYQTFALGAGGTENHTFPDGFSAYWVRAVSDQETTATVQFTYE